MRSRTTEHRRPRVAIRHINQHARADLDSPPGLDVGAQRQLVAGAACVVAVRTGLQDLGGELLEVGDRAWDSLDIAESIRPPG
jgi:hypothetical protein